MEKEDEDEEEEEEGEGEVGRGVGKQGMWLSRKQDGGAGEMRERGREGGRDEDGRRRKEPARLAVVYLSSDGRGFVAFS